MRDPQVQAALDHIFRRAQAEVPVVDVQLEKSAAVLAAEVLRLEEDAAAVNEAVERMGEEMESVE